MQVTDVLKNADESMKKALGVTQKELQGIRTGRANSALLDRVMVDYYGAPTPLKQLEYAVVTAATKRTEGSIRRQSRRSPLPSTMAGRVVRIGEKIRAPTRIVDALGLQQSILGLAD